MVIRVKSITDLQTAHTPPEEERHLTHILCRVVALWLYASKEVKLRTQYLPVLQETRGICLGIQRPTTLVSDKMGHFGRGCEAVLPCLEANKPVCHTTTGSSLICPSSEGCDTAKVRSILLDDFVA